MCCQKQLKNLVPNTLFTFKLCSKLSKTKKERIVGTSLSCWILTANSHLTRDQRFPLFTKGMCEKVYRCLLCFRTSMVRSIKWQANRLPVCSVTPMTWWLVPMMGHQARLNRQSVSGEKIKSGKTRAIPCTSFLRGNETQRIIYSWFGWWFGNISIPTDMI